MPSLHISKVAVGCGSVEALRRRQEMRRQGGVVPIITRFRPKRADELIGGSIYWIVKHRIAVRQTILGFAESEDRRTIIRLDPELVPVRALPSRAHQGWRYLALAGRAARPRRRRRRADRAAAAAGRAARRASADLERPRSGPGPRSGRGCAVRAAGDGDVAEAVGVDRGGAADLQRDLAGGAGGDRRMLGAQLRRLDVAGALDVGVQGLGGAGDLEPSRAGQADRRLSAATLAARSRPLPSTMRSTRSPSARSMSRLAGPISRAERRLRVTTSIVSGRLARRDCRPRRAIAADAQRLAGDVDRDAVQRAWPFATAVVGPAGR